jgi:hypothetical protein
MVDALRSAWTVLRPRGLVVDVRPAAFYRGRIRVLRGTRRLDVGPVHRDPDADLVAAERATRRVVADGWFDLVKRARVPWRARYDDLAQLDLMLAANENWHVPASTRRRLANVLTAGDVIEVSRVLALAILRRRAGRPRSIG